MSQRVGKRVGTSSVERTKTHSRRKAAYSDTGGDTTWTKFSTCPPRVGIAELRSHGQSVDKSFADARSAHQGGSQRPTQEDHPLPDDDVEICALLETFSGFAAKTAPRAARGDGAEVQRRWKKSAPLRGRGLQGSLRVPASVLEK